MPSASYIGADYRLLGTIMLGTNPLRCPLYYVITRFCDMLSMSSGFSLYKAIELTLLCFVENYFHNLSC